MVEESRPTLHVVTWTKLPACNSNRMPIQQHWHFYNPVSIPACTTRLSEPDLLTYTRSVARFDVTRPNTVKTFWDVTPCSLVQFSSQDFGLSDLHRDPPVIPGEEGGGGPSPGTAGVLSEGGNGNGLR